MDIKAYIETGVIESYVLGMADSQEAAELELLSRQYPEIREAIDAFELNLEKQSLAGAVHPSPEVKKNLLKTLAFEKEGKTPIAAFRWITAAAVLLLIASAALNVYYYSRYHSASDAYQALLIEKTSLLTENRNIQTRASELYNSMELMGDTAFIKISMKAVPGKEGNLATIFWDSRSKDVYLLPNKLAEIPADKQFQLWAIVDGKPVDAGMIGSCAGLCKMKNIPNAAAFAITLEKKGGSPTPNLKEMYVLGKAG